MDGAALSREELVQKWYDLRKKYNQKMLTRSGKRAVRCVMCRDLYDRIKEGDMGVGCRFYRGPNGSYIGECGGGGNQEPCDGIEVPPTNFVDSYTVRNELRVAKNELMREIKHIRDRVFGTEHLTDEDDAEFRSLTREYTTIRKMEDRYKDSVEAIRFNGSTYITEDERPETEGGANPESVRFKTNKIRIPKKDKYIEFSMGEQVLGVICKEDLPVEV